MRIVSLDLQATTLSRRTLHQAASGKPLDLTFLVYYQPHALFSRGNAVKLKEIFDQSDTIIEPWPDFEANCFRVGGPCRSAFKALITKL